ncbi:MAG: GH36 C-terminal domain-containing protein, partial [Paramuribaculum sp.]|nr:GH36 C-terminal domain-containing protein [Paramuribaculum sp.]
TDVAAMCNLGFDIGLHELTAEELEYCQQAVANWKRLQPTVMDGDQYRLVSPYETNHAAVEYVDKSKNCAVLFAYDLSPRFQEKLSPVRLQGLDPDKKYRVDEINLMPGTKAKFAQNGKVCSGDYLMKVGINVFTSRHNTSTVLELTAQN